MKAEWKTQKFVDLLAIFACVVVAYFAAKEFGVSTSWIYLLFAVASFFGALGYSRTLSQKMLLEIEVNNELKRLGYTSTLDGVSKIDHAVGVGFLGFFLGGKFYSVAGVAGDYNVQVIPHGDKVTYYIYKFSDTPWSMIAVVETNRPIKTGDVKVFCK